MRRLAAVLAVALVVPVGGGASDAAPGKRTVEVVPLDGQPVSGTFVGLADGGVRIEGRDAVPLDGIRELRFPLETAVRNERGIAVRVVLRGGEILRGRLTSGDAVGVELVVAGADPLTIPFDWVRRVEADGPDRALCSVPERDHLPREGSDIAYAKSGDTYAGTLAGASRDGVSIESGGERRTIKWSDLTMLHVDEAPLPPPTGLVAEVETAGGSRVSTTSLASDGERWTMKTLSGVALSLAAGAVRFVRFSGGRFDYASDLPFEATLTTMYSDIEGGRSADWYRARADRTADGCPLRVNGIEYRHGLWIHSKGSVRIPLGKRYVRFECRLAIDDESVAKTTESRLRGDVTARVLVDGKEAWSSGGSVKSGQPTRSIGPIDVRGAETLSLEVDFGENFQTNDGTDWCDPILVR